MRHECNRKAPKPMSEPSVRPLEHFLALSVTPAVPLWNSFGLFVSGVAFGFWDLCGMKFCILKVLPPGFMPQHRAIVPQGTVQKLRHINNEISPDAHSRPPYQKGSLQSYR